MDSSIKNILVIGAGQLGSRHIQGLLFVETPMNIWILDPSEASMEMTSSRAAEITHRHQLHFARTWNEIEADTFDLCIVATSANIREKVVTELLTNYTLKNLVLEKVLFQEENAYERVGQLIKDKKTATWVNHPRRMWSAYREIKNKISATGEMVQFNVMGGNWGLACNGLHFLDILSFITSSAIATVDAGLVKDIILQSKRSGFIELEGTIRGTTTNGSCFAITSAGESNEPITIVVAAAGERWFIKEGVKCKIIRFSRENRYEEIISEFDMQFQSSLTTQLYADIFENGYCNLPTYEDACSSHLPFLRTILDKYNTITGTETNVCPIT